MARFKTVKKEFASLPNEVIQGFYLSANAIALLITCLSYPNDWKYRPLNLWKSLKIGRDKTYAAFDELVEKGHCLRIRHMNGNLRAEVDYIFFDEVASCQKYIKENDKELSDKSVRAEHKWNFKKCLRHPECENVEENSQSNNDLKKCFRHPDGWESPVGESPGKGVSKKIETKKIGKKRYLKESIEENVDKSSCGNVHNSKPLPDSTVPTPSSAAQGSIPFHRKDYKIDISSPEVEEIILMEPKTIKYFRSDIITGWMKKFGPELVLETLKFFFHIKATQSKPIPNPEAWMEVAFKKNFVEINKSSQENKQFAENLKKKYRLLNLKINKRYCSDTRTGQDYYYHLPTSVFQDSITKLIDKD